MAGGTGADDLARRAPKAEIHLHLEGSIDADTILAIRAARGEPSGPAVRAGLTPLYAHRDFSHFLQNFRAICAHLRRPEDFALAATALSERLERDGVRYAEVFCSPSIFAAQGPRSDEIMDAVSGAARRRAAQGGPRMSFLFDGVRQFGIAAQEDLVRSADLCRRFDVVGIGMGGDERALPTAAFAPAYREARRLGLRTTVHAGEFDGPRSVWEALEILEAERIGHGIRALEDPTLVRVLASRGTPLECCPTSNVRTGIVRSWMEHPIPALYRAGVAVTVNSDDPALFGSGLADEWRVLEARLGLRPDEVVDIGLRTVRATFLPESEKDRLARALQREAGRAGVAP